MNDVLNFLPSSEMIDRKAAKYFESKCVKRNILLHYLGT